LGVVVAGVVGVDEDQEFFWGLDLIEGGEYACGWGGFVAQAGGYEGWAFYS
jgi:hypothetical protein